MRIDPKSSISSIAANPGVRRSGAGGTFSVTEETASRASSGTAGAGPIGSLDAILALQEEGHTGGRRRRAAKRGHDLLDALDRLKAALLNGRVPVADLKAIAARLSERAEMTGDPRLDEVIAHIELRAKVEIAKLQGRGTE
ncbi:MAG TPA: flagellar assembly protein FliX [Saliniramus sp.]|nr:flagellar assembly protein FliX [Saliniramus sp.]